MADDAHGAAWQRWLGLEMRHLAALAAVEREGSFAAAADALGYVQSAISQQIAQLERLVGTRVLDRQRGRGTITLTPAGRILLDHAEQLQSLYADANDAAAAAAPAIVRLGAVPSVAGGVLAQVLATLRTEEAAIDVAPVGADDAPALVALLADGAVEVAVGELPAGWTDPGVAIERVVEDRYVALVSVDSPLARRAERPTADELGGLRLIGTTPSPSQDAVSDWLSQDGAEPNYVVRCSAETAIQPLVAAGLGVAICPALAVVADQPGTVVRELRAGPPPRTITVARRVDGDAAAAAQRVAQVAGVALAARAEAPAAS
jgi:DNA-binding transcriptional LysR family regulator